MSIRSAYATHVGLVRDHNEDNCLARPDLGLWVVADGMGGHLGGEIASAIVIDEIERRVSQGESLADSISASHAAVIDAANRGDGQKGMGSTVVALRIDGTRFQIAWVGDSRAYLAGIHGLRQISQDHSFVQQLLDTGAISDEEAVVHPDRNVISQAIGNAGLGAVKVDSIVGQLHQGDQILLCSDGLTSEVEAPQIAEFLGAPGDEAQRVESLIAAALDHGGNDNVTVILVSAPTDAPPHPVRGSTTPVNAALLNRTLADQADKKRLIPLVAINALLLVLILALAAWLTKGYKGYWTPVLFPPTDPQLGPVKEHVQGVGSPVPAKMPAPAVGILPKSQDTIDNQIRSLQGEK